LSAKSTCSVDGDSTSMTTTEFMAAMASRGAGGPQFATASGS
jgi:hypothetical protein